MESFAASSCSDPHPPTGASAPDVDAWMKEEELAATGRAVNALLNVPIGIRDNAFSEVLLKVHALLDPPGAHDAAKAYMLITDVTRSFPGTDQESEKDQESFKRVRK